MSSRVHGGLNIIMRSALRITEARELAADPEAELAELVGIYRQRGVPEPLAQQVARALHDADPLRAHLRDELGHSDITAARPLQAATASAASFFIGGLLPLVGLLAPTATPPAVADRGRHPDGLAGTGILGARIAGTQGLRLSKATARRIPDVCGVFSESWSRGTTRTDGSCIGDSFLFKTDT
jgi:hypothetical protein